MKNLIIIWLFVAAFLLVAGNAQAADVWALYTNDGMLARVGGGDDIEIGIEVDTIYDWNRAFEQADYIGGVYVVKKFNDPVIAPYIGGRLLADYENRWETLGGPVGGVVIGNLLTIEGRYTASGNDAERFKIDEWELGIGFKLKF